MSSLRGEHLERPGPRAAVKEILQVTVHLKSNKIYFILKYLKAKQLYLNFKLEQKIYHSFKKLISFKLVTIWVSRKIHDLNGWIMTKEKIEFKKVDFN